MTPRPSPVHSEKGVRLFGSKNDATFIQKNDDTAVNQFLAERRKKKRHQDYLLQIINHQKEFQEFHRNVRNKLQRSNRALIAYYTNSEARMKREQERLEKERMRRLMAEDEEGYRKLIDKASFILDGWNIALSI